MENVFLFAGVTLNQYLVLILYIHDARHEKTDLNVFVVVIPKDGLAGTSSTKPSFGMTLTIEHIQ